MPFTRYVEIGRIALINYGEEYGKLVVISDVVDQNKVNTLAWLGVTKRRYELLLPAAPPTAYPGSLQLTLACVTGACR